MYLSRTGSYYFLNIFIISISKMVASRKSCSSIDFLLFLFFSACIYETSLSRIEFPLFIFLFLMRFTVALFRSVTRLNNVIFNQNHLNASITKLISNVESFFFRQKSRIQSSRIIQKCELCKFVCDKISFFRDFYRKAVVFVWFT